MSETKEMLDEQMILLETKIKQFSNQRAAIKQQIRDLQKEERNVENEIIGLKNQFVAYQATRSFIQQTEQTRLDRVKNIDPETELLK